MFSPHPDPTERRVVVTDIQIPFGAMVRFTLKWAIAAIPAIILLLAVVLFVTGMIAALSAGFITNLNSMSNQRSVPAQSPTPMPSVITPREFTPPPLTVEPPKRK